MQICFEKMPEMCLIGGFSFIVYPLRNRIKCLCNNHNYCVDFLLKKITQKNQLGNQIVKEKKKQQVFAELMQC